MKKTTKRLLSLFLAMALCAALCTLFSSCAGRFKPVLRFAVASDIHIADADSVLEELRLAQFFETAYSLAENSDTSYKKLDAVLFAGDLTNIGTLYSMQAFKSIMDDHIKDGTTALLTLGNHDFYDDATAAVSRFTDTFDCAEDEHTVINGFHFIRLSPSDGGNGYNEAKQAWLDAELAAASADTPHLPIFVMQHHHIKDTVAGSSVWGIDDLTAVLEKYPQVVDFSGHSHFPIMDPRSLHQDAFTSIGTGTLSFYELGLNDVTDAHIFPSNTYGDFTPTKSNTARDAAQFQIVEVNKKGDIRIIGYDLLSNTELFVRELDSPADSNNFVTNEEKTEKSDTPVFGKKSELTLSGITASGAVVTIPQATCDNTPVESYRVEVWQGDTFVKSHHALSGYIYVPMTSHVRCEVTGLAPKTSYTLYVYALNCYGKSSKSLTIDLTTS